MALDPKLQKFSTASQVLVNIDRGDFTSGLGYVEFFCFESSDNTSVKYNILNKALRGSNTHVSVDSSLNIEFISSFGVTQIMSGKIYAQFHWGFRSSGGSTGSHATISIEKNGVEIATERGAELTSTGNLSRTEVISFDVPNTTFSPGDSFKIRIVISFSGGMVNDGLWLAYDSLDTSFTPGGGWTGGAITDSVFKLNIPFQFI